MNTFFIAAGTAGLLPPLLAAWAANISSWRWRST